jgi:hypothetical protein
VSWRGRSRGVVWGLYAAQVVEQGSLQAGLMLVTQCGLAVAAYDRG